jgi:hypothetical protein
MSMEDEEEEISSYRMSVRKRKHTGSWKTRYYIALSRELALEKALDLS